MEMKELTAHTISCEMIYRPTEEKYINEYIRKFQGVPSLAITKGGRIYAGWCTGGTGEPHMDNFVVLIYSDDKGKTWSKPLLVIPSDRERWVHALDTQLWTAPDGSLYVYWVQNNSAPEEFGHQNCTVVDGFAFYDTVHAEWLTVCENPDDENPTFSEPRYVDSGFLRCKPLVMKDGTWMNCNYDQINDRYGYSLSTDQGKTWQHMYGAVKAPTPYDETMTYQKKDGSIRMFARTTTGEMAESTSFDNGQTWTETKGSGLPNCNSRFYVGRTPSGRIMLVTNDSNTFERCKMTVYLSEDDGETWKYKRCIDARTGLSYPDVDYYDGKAYLIYDRERTGAKEILFVEFEEADIIYEERPIDIRIISKP